MKRPFQIDHVNVNDLSECFVIAEIGHNHQGDLGKAKELIRQAKMCGADAVKFQKRDNKSLYTRELYEKPYEHENSFGRTYGEHREFLELDEEEFREIKRFCGEIGILFFATVFDIPSADFMHQLGVPAYKIASGDLKNLPLIRHVARFGKPLLISTGGGSLDDIEKVFNEVTPLNPQLCFMQCTASYPTLPEDIHLRVIESLRQRFPDTLIGFSDHYNGIAMAVAAYVLGARVIEKHFTLNHTWKGTDHPLSLEPIGLQKMVRDLRRLRLALGDPTKRPLPCETPNLVKMGKKIVAARALTKGHLLAVEDLAIKSPGDGISPDQIDALIGRKLLLDLAEDATILPEFFEGRKRSQ